MLKVTIRCHNSTCAHEQYQARIMKRRYATVNLNAVPESTLIEVLKVNTGTKLIIQILTYCAMPHAKLI